VNCTLNAFVSGVWAAREGEPVQVVETAPNGMAVGVLRAGEKRVQYVPARWIDGLEPAPVVETVVETVSNTTPYPERCPCCGQPLPPSQKEPPP